jgi:hypothetical protein
MIVELLACVGLMFILKYGTILDSQRKKLYESEFFEKLFSCSLCLGFWSGVFIAIVAPQCSVLVLPFASAALCWFADCIMDFLQIILVKIDK